MALVALALVVPAGLVAAPSERAQPESAQTIRVSSPDAAYPAAGICSEAIEDPVTIVVRGYGPSPRCVRLEPWDHVRLVNQTAALTATLGAISVELQPGEEFLFDGLAGAYLDAGVHVIRISIYDGSGPELWLV